ncbi:MAG: caspase family protein [Chlorobiaceae bacterium]|nr:caspase family protein [Chlorobiaceae bacterium]
MGKKALCVGINKFKNYPDATLNGCVNDATDMQSILKTYNGFTDKEIKVLTDAKATKAAIMTCLEKMVDGALKGSYDYLVFSLSSHGTQVPDTNGDEPDKADEAFCPHDLAESKGNWHPDHIITDDELHDLFIKLPKNVLLEVYFDTCHSGTGLKAVDMLLDRRPRYLPPPSLKAFLNIEQRSPRALNDLLLKKGVAHQILWSGCRSDQTSADAQIDGSWHGAFTYFFCKEMRASNNSLSRAELLKKVRQGLKSAHYTQVPQLETQATQRKQSPGSTVIK